MRICMIFASVTLIALSISGCGSGGSSGTESPVGVREVWVSTGDVSTSTTFSKDVNGTYVASGDWDISANGYRISCPFKDSALTLSKTNLMFKASGETTASGGTIIGVQKVSFTISASGTYSDGKISSGVYTITFSNKDPKSSPNTTAPPSLTRGWYAKKQAGGDVTYVAPVGNYSGTFSGGDSGAWQFVIDTTGHAEGTITSANYKKSTPFFGTHELDGSLHLQDSLDSSTSYQGRLNSSDGSVSGTWRNPDPRIDTSGIFSGFRQAQ